MNLKSMELPNRTAQSVLLSRLGLHHLTSTEQEVQPRVNKQMGTVRFVLEKSLRWSFIRLDTSSSPELTGIFSRASRRETVWNWSEVREAQTRGGGEWQDDLPSSQHCRLCPPRH